MKPVKLLSKKKCKNTCNYEKGKLLLQSLTRRTHNNLYTGSLPFSKDFQGTTTVNNNAVYVPKVLGTIIYHIKSNQIKSIFMKKRLLSFSMLVLGIGVFSTQTFAQDDAGGASFQGISVDGGVTSPSTAIVNPPSYVQNVKRNNGNGTSTGSAEVRLAFSDKSFHDVKLTGITNLDGSALKKGTVVMCSSGDFRRGYNSYALIYNILPKNKLLFHFTHDGENFCIPEL